MAKRRRRRSRRRHSRGAHVKIGGKSFSCRLKKGRVACKRAKR